MKKLHSILLLLLPAAILFSRCQKSEGYAIKGTIQNAASLQAVLEQAFFNGQPTAISRVTCDGSGKYTFEQKEALPAGVYRLSIGAKRLFFMLDGKEKGIEINADLNTMDKMQGIEVKGSETATCYIQRIQEMIGLSQGGGLTPEGLKSVADKGCNPLMKVVLAMQLINGAANDLDYFKNLGKELDSAMPGSKYALDYANVLAQVQKQALQQQSAELIKVGQPAPDISLPDPSGKTRSLSSLKGKVVLLDFWASWCGPCRRENPNVVQVYKKYKDKGFEVFSVSLDGIDLSRTPNATPDQIKAGEDQGRTVWKNAIQQDGLLWENHVSDLRKWSSSAAALYGVQSIPKTFLIDREGKIAVIETRGRLEQELLKFL